MELPWSSPGFVNVYFIEEKDGYVMIDCGVNGSEYQELLETKMKSFGLSYENIKLLIGTHMHSDHIGLSSTLREKDIPFALYKNSVEFIEGYNDWSIRFKKLKEYAKKEGAPKSFLDDIEQIDDMQLDYVDIVNPYSFKPLQDKGNEEEAVALIAVFLAEVRLIDNLSLND